MKPKTSPDAHPTDDDVSAEEQLVLSGSSDRDAIAIKRLTKIYDDGKLAVDNLSLGIAPGECFGLLGINGTSSRAHQQNLSTALSFHRTPSHHFCSF
jgi:ATPase subunit of ABC transporter with duplicated ATPase domains